MDNVQQLVEAIHDAQLHHIEFVTDPSFAWAVESNVLGVNPKLLYKLFYSCRARIEALLVRFHHAFSQEHPAIRTTGVSSPCFSQSADEEVARELYMLSTVALLATTENARLINTRKLILLLNFGDVATELRLLNVLMCSPLPKHNKSPLLWYHRRWLLETFFPSGDYNDMVESLYPQLKDKPLGSVAQAEFAIISIAAHMHPRNYYAWAYARWLLGSPAIATNSTERMDMHYVMDETYSLCAKHVSDISMWTFLVHAIRIYRDSPGYNSAIVEQYVSKARALAQVAPGHESMDYFFKWSAT